MNESRSKISSRGRPVRRRRSGCTPLRGAVMLAFMLGILLSAATTWAGSAEVEATDDACLKDSECLSHYQSARQLSKSGQSQAALEQYLLAYKRQPVARLLYSIARLQHRLGQSREAIASYQRFLATAPPGDAELRGKAQEYKAQLEHDSATAAPAASSDAAATAAIAAQPTTTAVTAAPTPRQPIYKKWWLWTIVGVAAAGAITATVIATYPREPTIPDNAQSYSPMF